MDSAPPCVPAAEGKASPAKFIRKQIKIVKMFSLNFSGIIVSIWAAAVAKDHYTVTLSRIICFNFKFIVDIGFYFVLCKFASCSSPKKKTKIHHYVIWSMILL